MASDMKAVQPNKWGKEAEQQLGAEDSESWKKEVYVDAIPWEYGRFRELLEKYAKIPPNEVESEILKIRNKAWDIVKYPCIGHFSYVRLLDFESDNPEMQKTIERLKAPGSQDTYLELGGFIFQTIRQLVFEGVDPTRLYGTDLHAEFIELGYDQFRDRETLEATFVTGDLLLPDEEYAASEMVRTFEGKMSIVHASSFFHLFSWESQLIIGERIVRFFRRGLSADNPAVLFGAHMGSDNPGEIEAFKMFLHDRSTFQALWDEIGRRTDTRWEVSMEVMALDPPKYKTFMKDARMMRYIVKQVVN